jgi:hypothetical protein
MSEVNVEQTLIEAKAQEVKFWAVGGTGINQLKAYRSDQPRNAAQLAQETFIYVDTSFANMVGSSADNFFVVNDGKGLGKDQREGDRIFEAEIPKLMLKHKPAKVNVVFYSLSGGTGSTGGRRLVKAIAETGAVVIAIVTGDYKSDRSTGNSLASLINLEQDLKEINAEYAISYHKNDPKKSLNDNNEKALRTARWVSMLASGKNGHIDENDVRNFFKYSKNNRYPAQLALLEVFVNEEDLLAATKDIQVISFGALMKSHDSIVPDVDAAYDTVGYLPDEGRVFDNSFYYILSGVRMKPIMDELKTTLAEFKQKVGITEQASSLLDSPAVSGSQGGTVYL